MGFVNTLTHGSKWIWITLLGFAAATVASAGLLTKTADLRYQRDVNRMVFNDNLGVLQEVKGKLGLITDSLNRLVENPSVQPNQPYIVVSIGERELWYKKGNEVLFHTQVATGSGKTLVSSAGGKEYKFDTPRGRLVVQSKEVNPEWVPPDWHFQEAASKKGLGVMRLERGSAIRASDGSVLTVQGANIVRRYPNGSVVALSGTEGREIIANGNIIIPPFGTTQRRYKDVLGTRRLNLGDGYGLHGTNVPESIGRAVSHGCIRLRNEDIEKLYEMVPVGTPVYIYLMPVLAEVPAKKSKPAILFSALLLAVATLGAVQFSGGFSPFSVKPFGTFLTKALPFAEPSASAFGASGGVLLRFAMPGEQIQYPLDVHGDPSGLQYEWIRLGETVPTEVTRALIGADVRVPNKAGFYRLALVRGEQRRTVEGLTLAVLVPFKEKEGTMLNGYRIGTYLAEKIAGKQEPPRGFLEISEHDVDLPISKHLKVGDFLSHDNQETWPRYAAVSPRLLDKLELVIAEITRWHGSATPLTLALDVHSGFRAPAHNGRIARAARDSQHQYGDAADVAMDANGDGKYTAMDSRMVGLAVEIVEIKHPELVGGLGVYTSGHARTTYVHIDARGTRARWRG